MTDPVAQVLISGFCPMVSNDDVCSRVPQKGEDTVRIPYTTFAYLPERDQQGFLATVTCDVWVLGAVTQD